MKKLVVLCVLVAFCHAIVTQPKPAITLEDERTPVLNDQLIEVIFQFLSYRTATRSTIAYYRFRASTMQIFHGKQEETLVLKESQVLLTTFLEPMK
jgi:hypothetical protein